MILNLSHPRTQQNINANIIDSYRTVKYSSVRQAIQMAAETGMNSFSAKIDIKDAFRLLPIHPQDHKKLCFKNQNQYFYDLVLPQGCSSSCFLFEEFSKVLAYFQLFAVREL